jgi:hypothetical protein
MYYFTVPQMLKTNSLEEADGKGTASKGSKPTPCTIVASIFQEHINSTVEKSALGKHI